MLARSLFNDYQKGSNLRYRHMICIGTQNRQAKNVFSPNELLLIVV